MGRLGIPNLHHLNSLVSEPEPRSGNCEYSFGSLFLMEIFDIIGGTAMGRALNQTVSPNYGYGLTDEELYNLFLTYAPDTSKDALRALYWRMHGAPFTSATPEPVAFSIHEAVAPVLTELLPWAANPPDYSHAEARRALVSLWWIDNQLMIDVAQFDWLADGVNHKELPVIHDIRRIAATDTELGKLTASFSWIVDDVKHWEDWAVRDLWLMVERNSNASSIIMHYPWMQDYLTFSEAFALQYFRGVIQREHWRPAEEQGIAEILVTVPWIADGLSRTDAIALGNLDNVSLHEKDFFTKVMSVPWIADGISSAQEAVPLRLLQDMAQSDLGLANAVLELPWTADGWDFIEWQALTNISELFNRHVTFIDEPGRISHLDPALALSLLSFPWIMDGINGSELSALGELRGITFEDPALGTRILGFGWFRDNITDVEARAVHHLHRITLHDIEVGRQVLSYPWVADGITESEVASLASMAP